jgi:hypothetical protein
MHFREANYLRILRIRINNTASLAPLAFILHSHRLLVYLIIRLLYSDFLSAVFIYIVIRHFFLPRFLSCIYLCFIGMIIAGDGAADLVQAEVGPVRRHTLRLP